jgi:hypothetical protein
LRRSGTSRVEESVSGSVVSSVGCDSTPKWSACGWRWTPPSTAVISTGTIIDATSVLRWT